MIGLSRKKNEGSRGEKQAVEIIYDGDNENL